MKKVLFAKMAVIPATAAAVANANPVWPGEPYTPPGYGDGYNYVANYLTSVDPDNGMPICPIGMPGCSFSEMFGSETGVTQPVDPIQSDPDVPVGIVYAVSSKFGPMPSDPPPYNPLGAKWDSWGLNPTIAVYTDPSTGGGTPRNPPGCLGLTCNPTPAPR